VTIPVAEQAKPRKVEIRAADAAAGGPGQFNAAKELAS